MSSSPNLFRPTYVVEPSAQHTHTAVLLHGRRSSGETFARELLTARLSGGWTLVQCLPGWRWVFPSSGWIWSMAILENMYAWFSAFSLEDAVARPESQEFGIKEGAKHVGAIVTDEVTRLHGRADRLVLGGIGQGVAMAVWTLLGLGPGTGLGGFVGASSWLPYAKEIQAHCAGTLGDTPSLSRAETFVQSMLPHWKHKQNDDPASTPVFLGHGAEDISIYIALGQQTSTTLSQLGYTVIFKEYTGAWHAGHGCEAGGHWLKLPEQLDDILYFLARHV